jgi:hypothetical protein
MSAKQVSDLCNQILNEKDKSAKRDLIKKLSRLIGYWDKADRYWIEEDYKTESSKNVRYPSREWNLSFYKHIFTTKYIKQLSTSPLLMAKKLDEEMSKDNGTAKEVRKI